MLKDTHNKKVHISTTDSSDNLGQLIFLASALYKVTVWIVVGCTIQDRKESLYVKSRTPKDFKPVTPSLAKPSLERLLVSRCASTEVPKTSKR
jgi:hypothetical protein